MTQALAAAQGQWYLSQNGKRYGPVAGQVLRQLAATGKVAADAWLLQAGTDVWVKAASVLGKLPAAKESTLPQAPRVPRPSALTSATPVQAAAAAPAPSLVLTGVNCPSCGVRCRIPKPHTPAVHRCLGCNQQFRAALTSVGVVARCIEQSGQVTVRNATPRTAALP